MFYFTSRRVSCAAIFVWSASVLLCTMPGPVSAIPIEARLAEIIGANHHVSERSGCYIHSCKVAVPNDNPEPGTTASSLVPTAPLATATPEGDTTTPPETPAKADPPAFVTSPESPPESPPTTPEEPSDTSSDTAPEPISNVSQTSGALGKVAHLSPLVTWVITCSAGAMFAML